MAASSEQGSTVDLIPPPGGALINLAVDERELSDLRRYASSLQSIQLSPRSTYDIELLAVGAFSPLDRFMNAVDYERVVGEMRLASGNLFPIPITLPVTDGLVGLDRDIALRDARNELIAIMSVEEVYEWDLDEVSGEVFQTRDLRHPLIAEMHRWGRFNISGPLRILQRPRHYDFQELRLTPLETRKKLARLGAKNVVAFQTRNPLHRVHEEITRRAARQVNGSLLLHPVVGMTTSGDVDHYTRVRSYKALTAHYYAQDQILLSLLPLAMRMAGPREALWHALIRRNYGANYMIIGRHHASPNPDSSGKPFYQTYAAQELVEQFSTETGVKVLPFSELVYLPDEDCYEEVSRVPKNTRAISISGADIRDRYLAYGRPVPQWLMRPEVADILAATFPPSHKRGVCVWFTGLSGAGKSTTAEVLTVLLQEHGRPVTLLDGDVVRTNLSRGLSFTKVDRDVNIRRIGFVASEIVRHGGVVLCAAVSPYRATRNDVRNMIGPDRFVEVFVDTPLAECERRDTKGMYARARRGEITNFTGIDDPYEIPEHPEVRLETVGKEAEANARLILSYLVQKGFIAEA